jgi:hypothetical protein
MAILKDKVPDIATVYAMDAADLPGYLLRALLSQDTRTSNVWHRQSCLGAIGDEYGSRETGCDLKSAPHVPKHGNGSCSTGSLSRTSSAKMQSHRQLSSTHRAMILR